MKHPVGELSAWHRPDVETTLVVCSAARAAISKLFFCHGFLTWQFNVNLGVWPLIRLPSSSQNKFSEGQEHHWCLITQQTGLPIHFTDMFDLTQCFFRHDLLQFSQSCISSFSTLHALDCHLLKRRNLLDKLNCFWIIKGFVFRPGN